MDVEELIRFGAAFIFVLGLIGLLALLARRFGMGSTNLGRGSGPRRRLGLVEVMPVDAKHRLILVRRDDTEHLILLGQGTAPDLLVESGIPAPRSVVPVARPEPQPLPPDAASAKARKRREPSA